MISEWDYTSVDVHIIWNRQHLHWTVDSLLFVCWKLWRCYVVMYLCVGTQITLVLKWSEYLNHLWVINVENIMPPSAIYFLWIFFWFIILIHFVSSLFVYSGSSSLGSASIAPLWLFLATGVPVHILSLVYLLTGNSVVGLAVSISYEKLLRNGETHVPKDESAT